MVCLVSIFSILSLVIGSGFISGKEIVVYFSRFGLFSFISIFFAFFLYFLFFRFILFKSNKILDKFKKSKILVLFNIIISSVFSGAMLAGIGNVLNFNIYINFVIVFLILLFAFIIFKKGFESFEKINFMLSIFIIFIFSIMLFCKLQNNTIEFSAFPLIFPFYTLLYVALNLSTGSVVIAKVGTKLSLRQKTRVAFWSALVLCLILLIANIVLLQNPQALEHDMPFLMIFGQKAVIIFQILIFFGCLTTFYSLVFSSSFSLRGLCKNEFFIFFISVIFPSILSLLGFGFIINNLYPLVSSLGIIFLIELFFTPLFKRTNKKIHSSSQDTK